MSHRARSGSPESVPVRGAAIITGSDSGIGRAAAVALAARGFDVGVTWHHDRAGAEGIAGEAEEHGRRVSIAHLDLGDSPKIAPTIDALADQLGGLDVLINNAGTGTALRSWSSTWTPGGACSRWT